MPWMSFEHGVEARRALETIVSDPAYGTDALSNAQVLPNLLRDLLPDAPRETGVLTAAAEQDLAGKLHDQMSQGLDVRSAIRLTASSFAASTAFTQDVCLWAAGELAVASGLASPAQVDTRRPAAAGSRPDARAVGLAGTNRAAGRRQARTRSDRTSNRVSHPGPHERERARRRGAPRIRALGTRCRCRRGGRRSLPGQAAAAGTSQGGRSRLADKHRPPAAPGLRVIPAGSAGITRRATAVSLRARPAGRVRGLHRGGQPARLAQSLAARR